MMFVHFRNKTSVNTLD